MGFLSSLSQMLGVGRRQVNVIVVGLDNSGKTTMLNYLRTPETRTSQIAPTVGYSVTNFVTENFSFTAFDMAGQEKKELICRVHAFIKYVDIIYQMICNE
ncbi:hypothetical protein NECAME_06332 [Necator americanus]|uniref:ADP-ribosylation factor family protein n=1 Tax=Necator americanus TaxID=51031 RepID=W2TVE3_NECAM|nr:hypothetical protein NECAME_06332 [Necator americanus]ETN85629.1 hypothetical protein NECAME_06332 [Necator americanus]